MSGLIHVTLPVPAYGNASLDEAWVSGGANGLLVAVDTIGTGHISTYPSDVSTVSLQIPFADGSVPEHTVLSWGPCHYDGANGGQVATNLVDL